MSDRDLRKTEHEPRKSNADSRNRSGSGWDKPPASAPVQRQAPAPLTGYGVGLHYSGMSPQQPTATYPAQIDPRLASLYQTAGGYSTQYNQNGNASTTMHAPNTYTDVSRDPRQAAVAPAQQLAGLVGNPQIQQHLNTSVNPQPSATSTTQAQNTGSGGSGTAAKATSLSSNPLFFDYGDDEDDETRLAEQKRRREEEERRINNLNKGGNESDNSSATAPPQSGVQSSQPNGSVSSAPPSGGVVPSTIPSYQQQTVTNNVVAAQAAQFPPQQPIYPGNNVTPGQAGAPHISVHPSRLQMAQQPAYPGTNQMQNNQIAMHSQQMQGMIPPGCVVVKSTTVWLGNLPEGTTKSMIYSEFCRFGSVNKIKVFPHKSMGFVTYDRREDAEQAKANRMLFNGAPIKLGWARGDELAGSKESFNRVTGESIVPMQVAQAAERAKQRQKQENPFNGGVDSRGAAQGRYPINAPQANIEPQQGMAPAWQMADNFLANTFNFQQGGQAAPPSNFRPNGPQATNVPVTGGGDPRGHNAATHPRTGGGDPRANDPRANDPRANDPRTQQTHDPRGRGSGGWDNRDRGRHEDHRRGTKRKWEDTDSSRRRDRERSPPKRYRRDDRY
eukprot:TRINITY_DN523_c0_g1_i4.p1 TRINITY_DN523_c0_g1~~TRINITY_DN523_c0_g1_i4.p1  ORF type:complete len:614 (-),score=112.70 TRINITY_DN523_c0_g1_i4:36-1877(-)